MKILFNVMTLSKGGAERVINVLSNELVKKHDVKILVNLYSNIEYEFDDRIDIEYLNKNSINHKVFRKMSRFSFFKLISLKNKIIDYNPDVIISFLPEPSLRLLLVKRLFKKSITCPIIISERNDPKAEYKNVFFYYLMKKLFPLADGFVFQTKDAQDYFKSIINCKQQIILNPIDDSFLSDETHFDNRSKEIVAVGRLEKQKNYPLLLEAFKKFNNINKEYVLKIYGSGSEKKQIESFICNNELEDYIKLMGNVSNVKDCIKDATLFVMSSDYEGLPNSLMEAMVLGVPSISTDCPCGGPRMLINDHINGILVPINDVNALFNAINLVISDLELQRKISRNGKELRKLINKNKILKDWEEFMYGVILK